MPWSSPTIKGFSSPTDDTLSTPLEGSDALSTPLFDADAFSTPEFWAAGGGGGDAFADLINASSSLIEWWSPNGASAANIADGGTAMEHLSGNSNPDILANVVSAGDWKIVADDIGSTPSLMSAVEANEQRRNASPYESNFCGIDSGTALSDDNFQSGFALFKTNEASWKNYQDIIIYNGTSGTSGPGQLPNDSLALKIPATGKPWLGYVGNPAYWLTLTTAIDVQEWYFVAWRHPSEDDPPTGDFVLYAIKVGDDWSSDLISASGAENGINSSRGITFGHESSHNADAADGWRWGPFGVFDADIGVGTTGTTLRTIFEAIS